MLLNKSSECVNSGACRSIMRKEGISISKLCVYSTEVKIFALSFMEEVKYNHFCHLMVGLLPTYPHDIVPYQGFNVGFCVDRLVTWQ